MAGKRFAFAAKASETRRLYGSINTQMIADVVSEEIGVTVSAKQIESQPLRMIGRYDVSVRLTVDLIPEIEIIVHREGESIESALEEEEQEALRAEEAYAEFLEEEEAEMEEESAADAEAEVEDASADDEPAAEVEVPEQDEEAVEEESAAETD